MPAASAHTPHAFGAGARALVAAAAFVVVCAGLKAASAIVVPILAAIFLAIVTLPPLALLRRSGLPRWASVVIVLGSVAALLLLAAWILTTNVAAFTRELPRFQAQLRQELDQIVAWLHDRGVDVSPEFMQQQMDAGALLGWMGDALGAAMVLVKDGVFVLLTFAFIMGEAAGLPQKVRMAIGRPDADISHYEGMVTDVQRYLAAKSQTNLLTAILVWLSCWALGTPFAVLIGVAAFFLNYVPTFGAIIAAVPAVLLTMIQYGPGRALVMAGLHVGINMVVGNILEPRLFGARFGLSALVVFLSLVFWGWLLGPVGMFLSVPLMLVVKIFIARTPALRSAAVLLGPAAAAAAITPARPAPASDPGASRGAKAP